MPSWSWISTSLLKYRNTLILENEQSMGNVKAGGTGMLIRLWRDAAEAKGGLPDIKKGPRVLRARSHMF